MHVMHVDAVVVMVNARHAQRYVPVSFILVLILMSCSHFGFYIFLSEIFRFVEKGSVAGIINASLLVTSKFSSSLLWASFFRLVSYWRLTL